MDGTDGSDGSAPDVYPKAEAVDSKPFLSTGDNHVLQIQFREKQNHVVKSSIRKGPHYYRKRAVPIPQTTKAPMLFFFSFLFINFFFFFFTAGSEPAKAYGVRTSAKPPLDLHQW